MALLALVGSNSWSGDAPEFYSYHDLINDTNGVQAWVMLMKARTLEIGKG